MSDQRPYNSTYFSVHTEIFQVSTNIHFGSLTDKQGLMDAGLAAMLLIIADIVLATSSWFFSSAVVWSTPIPMIYTVRSVMNEMWSDQSNQSNWTSNVAKCQSMFELTTPRDTVDYWLIRPCALIAQFNLDKIAIRRLAFSSQLFCCPV